MSQKWTSNLLLWKFVIQELLQSNFVILESFLQIWISVGSHSENSIGIQLCSRAICTTLFPYQFMKKMWFEKFSPNWYFRKMFLINFRYWYSQDVVVGQWVNQKGFILMLRIELIFLYKNWCVLKLCYFLFKFLEKSWD